MLNPRVKKVCPKHINTSRPIFSTDYKEVDFLVSSSSGQYIRNYIIKSLYCNMLSIMLKAVC